MICMVFYKRGTLRTIKDNDGNGRVDDGGGQLRPQWASNPSDLTWSPTARASTAPGQEWEKISA